MPHLFLVLSLVLALASGGLKLAGILEAVGSQWDPNGQPTADVGGQWDPNGQPTTYVGSHWDPNG
jgi:hypothetical protein